jgi:hypothetical protein
MTELPNITEEFDNDSQRVHEICILLSVDHNGIPETFYRLYVSPIGVDQTLMTNAMSYFAGAGFLSIECDCDPSDKIVCDINDIPENQFFELGESDRESNSDRYLGLKEDIESLRQDISEC